MRYLHIRDSLQVRFDYLRFFGSTKESANAHKCTILWLHGSVVGTILSIFL